MANTRSGKLAGSSLAVVLAIALAGCQTELHPIAPSPAPSPSVMNLSEDRALAELRAIKEFHAVASLRPSKVDMCHGTGNGSFHLINISADAESVHRAHGDARPGEPVPNNVSFQFNSECHQVAAATRLACPCWNTYSQQQLVTLLNAEPVVPGTTPSCRVSPFVLATNQATALVFASSSSVYGFACTLALPGQDTVLMQGLPVAQANQCVSEATALVPLITWCPLVR